ncbi:MAG: phosphoribosylformylglycinamidine synthase I [Candidatus Omnitrophica bacterium]|jgi:phosphoribosylformylglycinamidine synthase|nr:phosphoribosylformylglycinamidine synthase I [Candidatus Omnitrophota bacterium]MDD5079364.1 phosphoribosylformylglycinamidine synthase I [Candidatus Omnitrophota bacterium]
MTTPKVCVLRTAGTNCDKETEFAFSRAGASVELVHVNKLIQGDKRLDDYQILALPGGFTYGDDIAAGKILANELKYKLGESLSKFIGQGKLVIGICNGFQILVKSGFLPGNDKLEQDTSLIINDSGSFKACWVYLKPQRHPQRCVWTKGLPEVIYLPIAHGEGKFVTKDGAVLKRLRDNGQIVFQYCDEKGGLDGYPYNPNGSTENIAGICDDTGRVIGLMPHPERHLDILQHPRRKPGRHKGAGDGAMIFKNGVEYAKRHL